MIDQNGTEGVEDVWAGGEAPRKNEYVQEGWRQKGG